MRFVLAIVSFVLAAVLIGFGVAQRTVLASPDQVTAATTVTTSAPVTVVDGAVLNSLPRSQTVSISGADTIFAAYGLTTDVLAWVGDASYNNIGFDPEKVALTSTLVTGTEKTVPDPTGSDLWLADYTKKMQLGMTINVPENVSLIIVSDGTKPAPSKLSITWPVDNSAPWSTPLIIGGGALLVLGLGFLIWAILHVRKMHGPRRKQPKQPKMPKLPKQPKYKPSKPKPVESNSKGRRSIGNSMKVALPLAITGVLLLGGCTTGLDVALQQATTPTAAADEAPPVVPPAVTKPQAERIIARVSEVTTTADAEMNKDLIATRFAGPALELRLANYAIRGADSAAAALPAIPSGPVKLTLPQQTDVWPRTVIAVIQDDKDATIPPVALILIQEDARSQYKVNYAVTMEPSAEILNVAPANIGAARLSADIKLLTLPPAEVAAAYGDILMVDSESKFYDLFEAEGDTFREAVGLAKKNERKAALPNTASIEFSNAPGTGEVVALATNDSGALVAVNLMESETVKPVEAGAAVNPSGLVKTLSGVSVSTKGITATYSNQLLFYVPAANKGGKIILLGYTQGLVAASELP